MAQGIDIELLL